MILDIERIDWSVTS